MPERTYSSFAVVGAGPSIGLKIVSALLETGASVVVLSRAPKDVPPGAKLVIVDYTSTSSAAQVLKEHGVEVIVSALSFYALEAQGPLAQAAKDAGVKLFVPSEYGMPSEGGKEGHLLAKSNFAEHLKSLSVPSLRVYAGMFAEYIPWLTGVPDTGKMLIVGKGDISASFTSIGDVAGFLAYVLTTLPPSQLNDASFRIEGERISLSSVGALYTASATKSSVVTEYVDKLPESFVKQSFLQSKFEQGRVSSGWDNYKDSDDTLAASSGNKLWKGHRFKLVKEALDL